MSLPASFLNRAKRNLNLADFVPIEIEDDSCTPNPLFPAKKYGTTDFRTTLTRWSP